MKCDFCCCDAEDVPLSDGSFDVCEVHDGLHHLPRPFEAIAEMARVAREGLIIIEPNQPSPLLPELLYDTLINDVDGADVETVLVDGKVVVERRQLVNIDEEEVRRKVVEETTALWKRAGAI